MDLHKISIRKTARFFTLGKLNEKTCTVWFVCHGYGQLASYFIRKFEILTNDETFIIAPEGLSRFYLEGFGGKIGASWMTKEERLDEIEDYINYLNEIYTEVLKDLDVNKLKINVLGFSQGVATVSRWVLNGAVKVDKLILYAGIFPDDLDKEKSQIIFKNLDLVLTFGKEDELLKSFNFDLEAYLPQFSQIYPHARIHRFEGGHTILPEVVLALVR